MGGEISRRGLLLAAGGAILGAAPLAEIWISVNVMFDRGGHGAKGLSSAEIHLFHRYQEKAQREYATSGLAFDLHITEGAFLRTQGYSEIPDRFLLRNMINVFVTDTLGYDIDRDRTGGCSIGPRPRAPRVSPDPFYKTFLGLHDARDAMLPHEYAHHFMLDTLDRPTIAGNLWCDLRNDYWLWLQRHGVAISQFRACVRSPWAQVIG